MKALGRLFRFLFGLQSLSLAITIPAFLIVQIVVPNAHMRSDSQDDAVPLPIVLVTTSILAFVPAMAWWKLRKGRAGARWWAAAASLLCLPIPIHGILGSALRTARSWTVFAVSLHIPPQLLELAAGLTGLAVFLLRPDAIEPPAEKPKLERLEGDGTSKYWEYGLQGLVLAWTVFALLWWPHWGADRGLAAPNFGAGLAFVVLALFIEIVGHEFGHFAAGYVCGQKLRHFHAGPFQWAVRNGQWKFKFSPKQFSGGSVAMVPVTLENYRRRVAIMIAGGPMASLTLGVTSLVAVLISNGSRWEFCWFLLAMMATVSSFMFFANLIPQRTKWFYSDGAQLYQVLSNGPWAKVHLAFGMVATSMLTKIRPRDWDIGLINEATAIVKNGRKGMLLRVFASHYYLDSGNIGEAVSNIKAAESLFDAQSVSNAADFYAEFVFVNALYARDLPTAKRWWLKLQALRGIDYDSDYWRARASIMWLRGELEEARHAWERGYEMARKLPLFGTYDFTRWKFAELRKVLDQGDVPVDSQADDGAYSVTPNPKMPSPIGV